MKNQERSVCCGAEKQYPSNMVGKREFHCSKCGKPFVPSNPKECNCSCKEVNEKYLSEMRPELLIHESNCSVLFTPVGECKNPQCGRKLHKDNKDGFCHNEHCEYKVSPHPNWEERKEELAVKLHEWYLEACQRPESGMDFNPKAQELYELLPEGSKFLDRYIAEKVLNLLHSQLEEKEIVICAAIRMKNGYIIRGHRHSDAIATMKGIPRYKDEWAFGENQGFVTSRNRYVDRLEGAKIQKAAGIKSKMPEGQEYLHGELYSEDLY